MHSVLGMQQMAAESKGPWILRVQCIFNHYRGGIESNKRKFLHPIPWIVLMPALWLFASSHILITLAQRRPNVHIISSRSDVEETMYCAPTKKHPEGDSFHLIIFWQITHCSSTISPYSFPLWLIAHVGLSIRNILLFLTFVSAAPPG